MVADITEVWLLKDVLEEGVSRGVGRPRRPGGRADRQGHSTRDHGGQRGKGRGQRGHAGRGGYGHPDGAQVPGAAADLRQEVGLELDVGARPLEEVVGAFAAEALGLEGQRTLQLLQLGLLLADRGRGLGRQVGGVPLALLAAPTVVVPGHVGRRNHLWSRSESG